MITDHIQRDDIEGCASHALLRIWHQRFHDAADEFTSTARGLRETGRDEDFRMEDLARKIARAYMGMKRCERRAIEIGGPLLINRDGAERARIKELQAEVERLTALLGRKVAA